ncbi:MAG: hypothetical protein QXX78_06875 [Nitrososphaerota archaeon]
MGIVEKLNVLAQKWTNRAIAAQTDYEQAVASTPSTYWQQKALAAANTYNQAMQQVIAENRFALGVSNPKKDWQSQTRAKANRRVEGVRLATNLWAEGFRPFAETLDRVVPSLPARGPKMSDVNIQRAVAVMRAMHETKRSRRGVRTALTGITLSPKAPGFI